MSALSLHLAGDCWAPCHYCLLEDDQAFDTDDDCEDDE